jgi:beta-glucosidase
MLKTRASALFGLLFLLGCDEKRAAIAPELVSYCGKDAAAIEARIERVLASLTREQKALVSRGDGPSETAWVVAGLPELEVPRLAMIDGPRGVGKRAGRATAFPVPMARAATWDPGLERRVGEAIGRETRAYGIDVILAPTMNILRHPSWGRAQETYGEDPLQMARFAAAFVEGAQQHVLATAKHFAVNSIENTRLSVDVTIDERTLREVYLPHFSYVVKNAHVATVMSAYNSVNGAFCSENAQLLRQVLKDEWGFAGFVMSDWIFGTHDTVLAARAGLDLEMPFERIFGTPLLAAVDRGDVEPALLDDLVARRLRASYCHGLDTNPPLRNDAEIETPAARQLAREVSERSLVLLKNVDDALPLPRAPGRTIVVTGSLADAKNLGDTGSSDVSPSSVVTPLAGLLASAGPATIKHLPDGPRDAAAQAAVASADAVVVVVGLTASDEGEGLIGAGDRVALGLHGADVTLIHEVAALNRRVIVVLEGGSAITMDDFLSDANAVIFAWYPGVEGGTAIARVLLGEVNPAGRLPLAFPRVAGDLPLFDNTSKRVSYGYFHGYRHLDREGLVPLFPFGFGLSYSKFSLSELSLSASQLVATAVLHVSVAVTNTGVVTGRETVQVYLGAETTAISPRFARELRGFTQVELLPGERRVVTIDVPIADLGYWDTVQSSFVVEATRYRVEVGRSSRDLPLSLTIAVGP